MDFYGKVALITGSSRGIGASTAKEFAKRGCNVVINYNNSEEEAYNLQEKIINNYNVECMVVKASVTNEEEVKNMIEEVIANFGKIDILVNNAGIAMDTTFEDKTVINFKKILATNLIGPFIVSREVSKYMLKNKNGTIINIASTNGIDTYYPYSLDYDASKAGLISLTHNLAVELAPYIRVNAVAPGWVNTDMNMELDEDFIREEESKILTGRFAEAHEIAKAIVFLASDDASYINNEILRVDGGNYHG